MPEMIEGHSQDITEFRRLFPITEECVYFNHAATGPMSLPARRVVEECLDVYSRQAEFFPDDYFSLIRDARANVARFINASPEEIAFTHNTSEGIYIALVNLPLADNDTIIVMDEVFPAVRYAVDNNLPHVKKKYVSFAGKDPVAVTNANLERRVKAVVVDYVQFLSGETIELKKLAAFTREKGIHLIVDGIQGIGALDFDVAESGVDFLACGAAKWLFGPSGTGFLYVNKRNLDKLGDQHTGWLGAEWTGFDDFTRCPPLYQDARKYESGTRNVIGITALSKNIDILLQYGLTNIQGRIRKLKAMLNQYLNDSGFEIMTPRTGTQSGILTARPRRGVEGLYRSLTDARIIVSMRNQYLRFSPHFYNSEREVAQIIDVIERTLH